MLTGNALAQAGILRADEIATLTQIFEEIASSPQYLADKPAREELAAKILRTYQSGVTDPVEIRRYCSI